MVDVCICVCVCVCVWSGNAAIKAEGISNDSTAVYCSHSDITHK